MINNCKILALITARSGSKGIKNKNIKLLAGKPLIYWTIKAAQSSQHIDRLIISSDSSNIIEIARSFGCEAPFVRPSHLSQDNSSSMSVIMHALDNLEEKYDYLLLLQPTSPFRTTADIDAIINYAIKKKASIVVSVARIKKHPNFMYRIKNDKLVALFSHTKQIRRQDMPAIYGHNGALYLSRVDVIRKIKSYNMRGVYAFKTRGPINIDIDTPEDWELAEYIASQFFRKDVFSK